jgi:DNA-binding transcriptional regulator YdaS (Cro superfamily)
MNALERAIEAAGGLTKLAAKLEVSPQVIVNWRKRNNVPAPRVLDVEAACVDEATGEPRVTRHDLRPDLYPDERAAA